MKRIICIFVAVFCAASARSAEWAVVPMTVDWEAATGFRLSEYKITFADTKPAGAGWELYYLDEFPCYGVAQHVRAWISAKEGDGFVRVLCLRRPKEIGFAYRPAKRTDVQGRTVGMLRCKVEKDLSVKVDGCGAESWNDFARD